MNKTIIFLASLALFPAVHASASSETPVLPKHVVTASRYTDAERAIHASLAELRQSARVAPAITAQPALPSREVAKTAGYILMPVADSAKTALVAVKA